MKTTNDISEILNFAIAIESPNTRSAGAAATSAHTTGANDLKIEYQIHPPIITIVSCLRLSERNMGSSFSICTGILYCIVECLKGYTHCSDIFLFFKYFIPNFIFKCLHDFIIGIFFMIIS